MKHITHLAAAGVAALLLAGCSSEPSSGDIEKAVTSQLQRGTEAMEKLAANTPQMEQMAKALQTKVHSVKKIGCKSAGEKAYRCDVEVDLENGLTGRQKQVMPVRMVKASDGWAMSGM